MSTPLIKKLHMVIFMESSLDCAVNFYKKLGISPKFHIAGKWAELEIYNVLLGLCPTNKELHDRHTGIVFEVEDLLTTYNQLKDSITFINEPVDAAHGIMVSIKDPGGNIFDLYQPTPEKLKEFIKKVSKENCDKNAEHDCNRKSRRKC